MDAVLDWIAIMAVVVVIGFHLAQTMQVTVDPATLKVKMPTGAEGEATMPAGE